MLRKKNEDKKEKIGIWSLEVKEDKEEKEILNKLNMAIINISDKKDEIFWKK